MECIVTSSLCVHPVFSTQVDLAQLHALLVRRFGRCASASSNGNEGDERGGVRKASSSSCAAVERVRRKLLASSKGLGGLRAALVAVSCGGGGNRGGEARSLTKVHGNSVDVKRDGRPPNLNSTP